MDKKIAPIPMTALEATVIDGQVVATEVDHMYLGDSFAISERLLAKWFEAESNLPGDAPVAVINGSERAFVCADEASAHGLTIITCKPSTHEMLMHTQSGNVAPRADWYSDYQSMDVESWFGLPAEQCEGKDWLLDNIDAATGEPMLVEVFKDGDDWV